MTCPSYVLYLVIETSALSTKILKCGVHKARPRTGGSLAVAVPRELDAMDHRFQCDRCLFRFSNNGKLCRLGSSTNGAQLRQRQANLFESLRRYLVQVRDSF